MAQEDYLSGSQYGKVAGSLLASRNKTSKKNATKALLASALFETLGTLQKNQKTKIIEGYEKLKENYDDYQKKQFKIYLIEDEATLKKKNSPTNGLSLSKEIFTTIFNIKKIVYIFIFFI